MVLFVTDKSLVANVDSELSVLELKQFYLSSLLTYKPKLVVFTKQLHPGSSSHGPSRLFVMYSIQFSNCGI